MIHNVHERRLSVPAELVGGLIDTLASPADELWPYEQWPAMRFDRQLSIGARGGHGPVRYHVEDYVRGRSVRFRFDAPTGFNGYHEYVVVVIPEGGAILRHSLVMRTTGTARLHWPLLFRPLHDALIEDSLDKAGRGLGVEPPEPSRWNWPVRHLRTLTSAWIRLRQSHRAGRTVDAG